MSSEDMVHAPSRVLSPDDGMIKTQAEELDHAIFALELAIDRNAKFSTAPTRLLCRVYALLRLAQSTTSPELIALGEAAVKWASHNECYGSAYDDREAFLGAAKDYARSLEERGEQAAIPSTERGR